MHARSLEIRRLEELHTQAFLHEAPQVPDYEHEADAHSEDPQRPVDVPRRRALPRLLDRHPHEARVRQRDRQRDPSQEAGELRQERQRDGDEEVDGAEEGAEARAQPPGARPVLLVHVPGLHVVVHGHGVDLERGQAVDDHQQRGDPQHHPGHVAAVELVQGAQDAIRRYLRVQRPAAAQTFYTFVTENIPKINQKGQVWQVGYLVSVSPEATDGDGVEADSNDGVGHLDALPHGHMRRMFHRRRHGALQKQTHSSVISGLPPFFPHD